jgi:hypothetical protein
MGVKHSRIKVKHENVDKNIDINKNKYEIEQQNI